MDHMIRLWAVLPVLLGRTLIGLLFVHSGRRVFADPAVPIAKLQGFVGSPVLPPAAARRLVRLNAAIMVIAGSALGLGVAPRASAWVLMLALQPTNIVGHDFWARSDPKEKATELGAFLTNLAITGGLLSGKLLVDRPAQRALTSASGAAARRRRRTP
jgi:putative oxidoreductase